MYWPTHVAGARGVSDLLRRKVIRTAWGADEIPFIDPTVTLGYTGQSFRSDYPAYASRCDLLVCPLPRGGVSNVHLIHPPYGTAIGRLVVLHAGHQEKYYDPGTGCLTMAQGLASAGYHVLGVCMPCSAGGGGFNPIPLVLNKAAGGTMSFTSHEFQEAEADGVATLRLFVDPVVTAIRWAVRELRPKSVDMTGISGGGWTTDMVAGLCRLVRRSVPVFGSLPFSLRPPGDVGDYEQSSARTWWDPIETQVGLGATEVLYALGGTGAVSALPGEASRGLELGVPRRRLQILGPNDPVFPVTTVTSQVNTYNTAIRKRVGDKQADVWLDTTTSSHTYTSASVAKVLEVLAAP